jgi:class 3 adenylate cyclase
MRSIGSTELDAPTGTVTFLFTDIEGSTKLWEAHPETMRTALARHDELMREGIVSANGYVFKTVGDAFCAAFAMAADAVSAALTVQLALGMEPWPETAPIKVRMALHTGAVESRNGDYFGPALNRVARLLPTGHGGQTLLSQSCYELTRDCLPEAVSLRDLGAHQLKDLARAERLYQLQHPALPANFPPLKSLSITVSICSRAARKWSTRWCIGVPACRFWRAVANRSASRESRRTGRHRCRCRIGSTRIPRRHFHTTSRHDSSSIARCWFVPISR